ncbi:MAG: S16 family serine protease [Candidatus Diapherotrites archaeon]
MKKFFLVFVLLILFSFNVSAVITNGSMKIFAVTGDGGAISADLTLTIEPGTGKIWSSVNPLVGTTTQSAERTALKLARNYYSKIEDYDYKFDINSDASMVEGPSAGAAMALLTISMLEDKKLDARVGITGTISEDGTVGSVAGVFEKSKEAARTGIRLFMIPKGSAKQMIKTDSTVKNINLVDYAIQEWTLKVVEVQGIDEVLKLAFTPIEQIDVNKGSAGPEEIFEPKPIPLDSSLYPMQSLTKEMIEETKERINEAKASLSNTRLSDQAQINFLLSMLNSAESTLKETQSLYDNNYLYSAANNAFLANVYASLVKDVSDNPSLLDDSSTLFKRRLEELGNDITNLKANLDSFVPIDQLDWYIAAQERLAWSQLNLEKLQQPKTTIVVDIREGSTTNSTALEDIQDYEFAVSWYKASKSFYEIAKNSTAMVKPDDHFKGASDNYLVNAENGIKVLDSEDIKDIQRRLEAAKKEEELKWFLAELFDSSSSVALINAELDSKDKDFNALHSMLQEKINSIESSIKKNSSSKKVFGWSRLYVAHARYFLDAAYFYQKDGQVIVAKEKLKNGLSLAYLSEALYDSATDIYSYYGTFSESQYIKGQGGNILNVNLTPSDNQQALFNLIMGTVIVALIVFVILLLYSNYLNYSVKPKYQAERIKKLQLRLDEALASGRISQEKHSELSSEYKKELELVEGSLKSKSTHLIDIDRFREELKAKDRSLAGLKRLYGRGLISEQEYKKRMDSYTKEKSQLLKEERKEERELKKDEEPKIDLSKLEKEEIKAEQTPKSKPKPKRKSNGKKTKKKK